MTQNFYILCGNMERLYLLPLVLVAPVMICNLRKISIHLNLMEVVVLPEPFGGMGAWRNSTETQL